MPQALQLEGRVLCNQKLSTDLLTLHLEQNFCRNALSILLLGELQHATCYNFYYKQIPWAQEIITLS